MYVRNYTNVIIGEINLVLSNPPNWLFKFAVTNNV